MGMRLLDLEQLQMETHTVAQALAEKENDKTALQAARRQSVQVTALTCSDRAEGFHCWTDPKFSGI